MRWQCLNWTTNYCYCLSPAGYRDDGGRYDDDDYDYGGQMSWTIRMETVSEHH